MAVDDVQEIEALAELGIAAGRTVDATGSTSLVSCHCLLSDEAAATPGNNSIEARPALPPWSPTSTPQQLNMSATWHMPCTAMVLATDTTCI